MRNVATLLVWLFLSACVTVIPSPYRLSEQLVVGETTLAEATSIMGRPTSVTEFGNGNLLVQWSASDMGGYEIVSVTFDGARRLISIDQRTSARTR